MKFKTGDKVVRKEGFQYTGGWNKGSKILTVTDVECGGDILLEGVGGYWNATRFELVQKKSVRNLPAWF